MGKYDPLGEHLASDQVTMTFAEFVGLVGGLPVSAIRHRPWWGNERSPKRVQALGWLGAGYEVDEVDQAIGVVRFRRV